MPSWCYKRMQLSSKLLLCLCKFQCLPESLVKSPPHFYSLTVIHPPYPNQDNASIGCSWRSTNRPCPEPFNMEFTCTKARKTWNWRMIYPFQVRVGCIGQTGWAERITKGFQWVRQCQAEVGLIQHGIGSFHSKKFSTKGLSLGTNSWRVHARGIHAGLICAAELFDPEKGLRFSTYATIWRKGALQKPEIGWVCEITPLEKKAWNDIKGLLRDLEAEQADGKSSRKVIAPNSLRTG